MQYAVSTLCITYIVSSLESRYNRFELTRQQNIAYYAWAPTGIFPGRGANLWGAPKKSVKGGPHIFLDKL